MGRASLIIVMGAILTAGALMLQINQRSSMSTENAIETYERTMAYDIAQSGAQVALRLIRENPTWRSGYASEALFDGEFDVDLNDPSSDPGIEAFGLRITTTGRFGNAEHQMNLSLFRPPFCYYLYFTHYEPTIYFITGDVLDGPVHTNGTLHVNGAPTFLGRVTSPSPFAGSGEPELLSGANWASRAITLPTDLSELQDAAAAGGLKVTWNHLWLWFVDDGTVEYASSKNGARTSLALDQINGAIYGTKKVHIQGTLQGQVTVLSGRNMYIEDDVLYSLDPRDDPESTDYLGMISKKNILVEDNTANRDDVIIHGGMMALNTKFTVEYYTSGSPRGTLYILGSMVQMTRGAVGTFGWGGAIRTGYQKDYQYDVRFKTSSPPYYPRSVDYVLRSWAE